MKKTLYIGMFLSILTMLISCEKASDFLDKKPLGEYSGGDVWGDPALGVCVVNAMYRSALGLPFSIERLSDYSDESHFTPEWGVTDFNKCLMTQDDLKGWMWNWSTPHTNHYSWDTLYKNVRRANIFFQNVTPAKYADDPRWETMAGEAYFLRGYTYHYLVALFGGVPLITKAYGLSDNFEVARNSYEDCINFIVGQLDSAAMLLPETWPQSSDNGRATKGAALALKARVLLYAASDLHDKMSTYAPGFSNPELLGYTTGNQADRWTAAKNAAKAVIDMGTYSLYKATPAPNDSIAQNFVEFFTTKGLTSEDILVQYFSTKTDEGWQGYNPALYCGPNGYHNWGNNCPLGDLVDDYEMKDGSRFDWSIPAEKANPYANRDARLYATILYEGVQWRTRPPDALMVDPYSRIQVGRVVDAGGNKLVAGLDTRDGQFENWNGGYTGYYVRKFVDPTLDPQYVKQEVPFRHMRYAEVLLNYAEACAELGDDAEARTYVNMIRTRAGQPDIAESGTALIDAIRHERRIELAYEDHRFWDVRRWMIGPTAYHQTHAVKVTYVTAAATSYRQPDGTTWGDPVFENITNPAGDARAWLDKAYFFPITRTELNRNTMLIENPGY
jgi:starch-binding outer membrane protein, SusD/RagB family